MNFKGKAGFALLMQTIFNSMKFSRSATAALVICSLMLSQPAYAATIDVDNGAMNFGAVTGTNQPDVIGDSAGLGFTHLYDDVFAGVDAIATVIAIENLDSDSMEEFDDESSSRGRHIYSGIDIDGESGFVKYRIDFVAADTTNGVTLQNISITVADIDVSQYAQFSGISAYELSEDSELTVTSVAGNYEFKEPLGEGASYTDEENWAKVEYAEASSIVVTLGARNGGGPASWGVSFEELEWGETPNRVTIAPNA